jgi:hypothetical protein
MRKKNFPLSNMAASGEKLQLAKNKKENKFNSFPTGLPIA